MLLWALAAATEKLGDESGWMSTVEVLGKQKKRECVGKRLCSERAREKTLEFSFHAYLGMVGGPVGPQGVTAHNMSLDPMQLPVCPGNLILHWDVLLGMWHKGERHLLLSGSTGCRGS